MYLLYICPESYLYSLIKIVVFYKELSFHSDLSRHILQKIYILCRYSTNKNY